MKSETRAKTQNSTISNEELVKLAARVVFKKTTGDNMNTTIDLNGNKHAI